MAAARALLGAAPMPTSKPPAAEATAKIKSRRLRVEAALVRSIATSSGLYDVRGAMNGASQTFIRAATADIGNIGVDVGIRRLGIVLQKRNHGHDLSRLAVAALRNALLNPRALHWMVVA